MKKRAIFALVIGVLMCMCCSIGYALESKRVFDEADILSEEEEQYLEKNIEIFQMDTAMDFVVLTLMEEHTGISQQAIADAFYDQYAFGMAKEKSGILYLIDMQERIPYLSTCGTMIDIMTDSRLQNTHSICYKYLSNGYYAKAIECMMNVVEAYVYDGIPFGQYRYV